MVIEIAECIQFDFRGIFSLTENNIFDNSIFLNFSYFVYLIKDF